MSTEILHIKKPDAVKAYQQASTEGKELLVNLLGKQHFYRDPKEWVKTKEDVCEAAGISAHMWPANIEDREKLIMSVFNRQQDGTEWKPNWADRTQQKWRIWVETHKDDNNPLGFRLSFDGADYVRAYAFLGCRLYFKDKATAEYIGRNLLHLLTDSIVY